LQTLIFYLILSLSYFGWGWAITLILGKTEPSSPAGLIHIWLGWAATLFIFQILHLFFPLTASVVVPIFAIGIIFSCKQVITVFKLGAQKRSTIIEFVIISLIMLILAVWIASRSMLSPENYDSGLYHFNTIRWINSFPIVPGLGNLASRLAFNQSFFVYVAALNLYPFFNHGYAIANSFLFLLTFATFVGFLRPVFKRPSILLTSHPFRYLPALFALPLIGYIALSSKILSSPEPDLASAFLQLALFVIFVHSIADWINGQHALNYYAMLLTILAATSVTIKLSNLAFSSIISVFILAYIWQSAHRRFRDGLIILFPGILVIMVWCLRGFLLSGAPLYPSTIGYIPVVWSVPREKVIDTANWIYSWTRQPNVVWTKVLDNWNWFKPWLLKIYEDNKTGIVYPFALSIFFGIINASILLFYRKRRLNYWEWVILLPVLFALIYWFFTAPAPRFANALFFLMALCMILLFLTTIQKIVNQKVFVLLLCLVFMAGNLSFIHYAIMERREIKDISLSGYQAITVVPLVKMETQSGLMVYTPETGDQCWDAPLPCTPEFNASLMLRKPGDLGSGFVVK
jgi:hypothetical protein